MSRGRRCLVIWILPWTERYIFCCCLKTPQPCLTDIFIKFLLKHVGFFKTHTHTYTQPSSESSNLTPHVLLGFPKHWGRENMFPISSRLSVFVFYSAPCWGGPDPGNLQGKGVGRGVRPWWKAAGHSLWNKPSFLDSFNTFNLEEAVAGQRLDYQCWHVWPNKWQMDDVPSNS